MTNLFFCGIMKPQKYKVGIQNMSYKDDVKYGVDENGKLTMTAIDYKEHNGMNPHAHDIDMSRPFTDYDSARGEGRGITEEEKKEYGKNGN